VSALKRWLTFAIGVAVWVAGFAASSFQLPTPNQALFEGGGGERYFVGTVGKPWTSGTFGCVRSNGRQLHEGIDIRAVQKDKRGEALDPVFATADGEVVYINRRAALSNYGIYIVLRHVIDGFEVYSLYAHLKSIRSELQTGRPVKSGETIGIMGRTTNTREGIDRSRSHLHFELNLLVNDRFPTWYAKEYPKQRNDHGKWNGQNLVGMNPAEILLRRRTQGQMFNLVNWLQEGPEMCRVLIRDTKFSWLQKYQVLVEKNPVAPKEGIAAYELVMNYAGIPFKLIPRARSEVKAGAKFQLLSVNAAEAKKNSARDLVVMRKGKWELGPAGLRHLELLTY
jgi:peptidoglycan LD-endopeptidase LytH